MPIQRGDIYFVNLNPVQGREQAGQRPVLVLSIDAMNRLPLVVTVVVGTKGDNVSRDYPTNVRLSPAESGLPMETVFLGFQLRSLDPKRFSGPPAGRVTGEALCRIETAVRYCLGL
jgi:mRNA interferase MazF